MTRIKEEIVSTPEGLLEACRLLESCPVIGLDTEFVGEGTYHPRLCLVQVATPGCLLLIDPFATGPLDPFWEVLVDPRRVVVVHAGREEVRLCRLWSGRTPGQLFDLQLAAGLVGKIYPIGHGALVNTLLGKKIPKGETLTEWRRRPLTPEQIGYAFDDVRYLLPLYEKLHEDLTHRNRVDWATEEFQDLMEIATPDGAAEPEERWRKLKGLGGLDRRKLALVRALFNWREERAAALNRPARTLLRDDLILEVARRNPMRSRDLQVVRGLPLRELDAMVELANQTRKLPVEQCPEVIGREIDPPQMTLISAILLAVLGDFCHREMLAQSLVATNGEVRELIRARMAGLPEPDSNLTTGWRAKHVLPVLRDALDGKVSVRIGDPRSQAPLEISPQSE